MKINRKELEDVLTILKPAKSNSDSFPILNNICFDGEFAYVYNGSVGIITSFAIDGKFLVQFTQFEIFVKNSKAEEIEVTTDDEHLYLACGKSKAVLSLSPVEDYPDFSKVKEESRNGIDLPNNFLGGLKFCLPFISNRVGMFELTGLHLTNKVIESGDGTRLARFNFSDNFEIESVILSNEIVKIITKFSNIEKVFFGDDHVSFISGGTILFGSLIDGNYPPISQFFPSPKKFIVFPKDKLKQALLKVGDFSGDIIYENQCEIEFGDKIIIRYKGQVAKITEFLDFGKKYPKGKFNLNPYHFSALLNVCDLFSFHENSLYGKNEDGSFEGILALKEDENSGTKEDDLLF